MKKWQNCKFVGENWTQNVWNIMLIQKSDDVKQMIIEIKWQFSIFIKIVCVRKGKAKKVWKLNLCHFDSHRFNWIRYKCYALNFILSFVDASARVNIKTIEHSRRMHRMLSSYEYINPTFRGGFTSLVWIRTYLRTYDYKYQFWVWKIPNIANMHEIVV